MHKSYKSCRYYFWFDEAHSYTWVGDKVRKKYWNSYTKGIKNTLPTDFGKESIPLYTKLVEEMYKGYLE